MNLTCEAFFLSQVSGMPNLTKQIDYLKKTLDRTVVAVTAAAPGVQAELQELAALKAELEDLNRKFEKNELNESVFLTQRAELEGKLARAGAIVGNMGATVDSIRTAIDPAGLQVHVSL